MAKFNFVVSGIEVKVPEVQFAETGLFGPSQVVMGTNEIKVQGVQFGAEVSAEDIYAFQEVQESALQTGVEFIKNAFEYVTEEANINRLVKAVNILEDADTNLSIKSLANMKLRMQAEDKYGIRPVREELVDCGDESISEEEAHTPKERFFAARQRFQQRKIDAGEVPADLLELVKKFAQEGVKAHEEA